MSLHSTDRLWREQCRQAALVLVGHGSTLNADSSEPTFQHAATIRERGIFSEVWEGFWKEEPNLRQVLRLVAANTVFVVPNFISSGYFTEEVIPRELGLEGAVTQVGEKLVYYCQPVGLHESMTEVLLRRAEEVVRASGQALRSARESTCLLIIGHGTGLNDHSTKVVEDQVRKIRERGIYAECQSAYMEQAPEIKDWASLTAQPEVIAVPFFISDGLHSYDDIPVLLGIPPLGKSPGLLNPYFVQGRRLWYARAIGTEPWMAEVILAQVGRSLAEFPVRESREPRQFSLPSEPGPWSLGEVVILPGYEVRHGDDANCLASELTELKDLAAWREFSKHGESGEFRPVRGFRGLRRGWRMTGLNDQDLCLTLNSIYPGALALWREFQRGTLAGTEFWETAERQTGMYRLTRQIKEEQLARVVEQNCRAHCLRERLWGSKTEIEEVRGRVPLLCPEACNYLVGKAREEVRRGD